VKKSFRLGALAVEDLDRPRVLTGLARVLEERSVLEGKRIGLIANATSVDASLAHAADRLRVVPGVQLIALFGPEHGLRGHAQDQIELGDAIDERTGLRVHSLYGATRVPTPAMLRGLDALVFDVQDIGARYYTFIWTLAHAMEACARDGLEMIVLDRPNPIGGAHIEGNLIEPGYTSFVGLYPIPNRHGMTVGELARLFNDEFGIGCRLSVVPMRGWRRDQWFTRTGLPWVLPSPNMPTLATALVYPGACLVEGTNLSEGRGTTRTFEIVGAPWVDPYRLVAELQQEDLPGVSFRPLFFEPTFHKFAGQVCGGVQQHLVDRSAYRPLRTGVALLKAVRRLWPSSFRWREPPYEYETSRPAIDVLAGTSRLREQVEADAPLAEIERRWKLDSRRFHALRAKYLLYR
jgi:uncharacterized protein YbbC (DUF1343 family)